MQKASKIKIYSVLQTVYLAKENNHLFLAYLEGCNILLETWLMFANIKARLNLT